ncbi:hypothetical protein OROHE_009720 [Orobanche hederae]
MRRIDLISDDDSRQIIRFLHPNLGVGMAFPAYSTINADYRFIQISLDDPCTNVGRGSNLTEGSHVECDASVMDVESGAFGAVGALQCSYGAFILAIGTARGMYTLKKKRKRKREANKELEVNQTVNAMVEIVKENYVHVSATVMALPAPATGGRLLLLLKSLHDGVKTSSSKRAKKRSSASKSDPNSLSHINVGDVIHGRIRRVDSYGLFISIDHTNVGEGSS